MKLCDTCETTLPDTATICDQCGTSLPGSSEVIISQDPTLLDDRTIAGVALMPEVEEMAIKGLPVLNPETPIPDALENLPTLASSQAMEYDDVITGDPTPTLPIAQDDSVITDDPTPTLPVSHDADVITGDPSPTLPVAQDADAILDDPTPASLLEHDADVITDDPTPLIEHQSDTAIIRADAPILETDPRLSAATSDALALLSDQDDATAPGNGHRVKHVEESDTLSVASFLESGEETPLQHGRAIPAPLYPDYGKASNTPPTPLYEDYKNASTGSTATAPTMPRISTAYPHIWSRRNLIALALCLLIILGSIGLIITKKSQTGGGPVTHSSAAKLRAVSHSLSSQVVKGHKVILVAAIANDGGQALRWTADSGQTTWLSVDKASGIIPAGAPQYTIYARVDATSLDVGNYSGALQIHSNGGSASILIALHVIAADGKSQPIMTIDPTTLTFGSLQRGQQATKTIYISNSGTATLNWQANVGNADWITLTPPSGTIVAGSYPQQLVVTVNTTKLNLGLSPANLYITSNASATQPPVTITVDVTAASGNALTISATPGSFTNGCLNCAIILTASQGGQGSQPSVQWSTSGVGVPGISFNPSAGTLQAGQSVAVTVTVPNTTCPASANFTFTGAANTFSVVWSCTPPPTPNAILTASPTSLTNCYTCTVNISPAAGSQSSLKWTSTSSGINGITISPSGSTVAAGISQAVTITVPNTNCPSNANRATITFSGQGVGNSVPVYWTCTQPSQQTPTLNVNPTSLNQNSSVCSLNGSGSYTCNVTLTENPQGTLNWQENNTLGVSVSQQSGTLTPGNSSATIILNSIPCQSQGTNGTFTFSTTGSNSVSVNWACTAPPTVTVTPPTTVVPTPTAPSNVSATAKSSSSINVTWSDNSNNETGFTIYNGVTSATVGANTTSYTWGGLAPGTNMCFSLSAYNAAGSSSSTAYVCATTLDIPTAPSNVSATATSASSILVKWSDNSNNEDGFTIYNGVTSATVGANTTSYTWGGLAPGTYMCFSLSAYNAAGSSSSTAYVCATTLNIPNAPSNISVTATSASSILVKWNDNSNNEDGFTVSNGVTSVNVAANTTSYSWGGLTAGSYMCVHILAYNSAGSSAWTPYACTTTPSIPAAPSNVSATATSASSILVKWSDNSNNETGFTIYNGVTSATVGANTTSYTWGGLASGTYMCFSLSAYNAAGSSAGTQYVCATTPSIPNAPSNVSATATSSSSILVTWNDNSNNETGFTIYNGVTSVTVGANTTSYTWGGLASGTYMCFSLSAYNAAGSSAGTQYVCATT